MDKNFYLQLFGAWQSVKQVGGPGLPAAFIQPKSTERRPECLLSWSGGPNIRTIPMGFSIRVGAGPSRHPPTDPPVSLRTRGDEGGAK